MELDVLHAEHHHSKKGYKPKNMLRTSLTNNLPSHCNHKAAASDPPPDVSAIAVSSDDRYLVLGDSLGWLHAYELGNYGMSPTSADPATHRLATQEDGSHGAGQDVSPDRSPGITIEGVNGMRQPLRRRSGLAPHSASGKQPGGRSRLSTAEGRRPAAMSAKSNSDVDSLGVGSGRASNGFASTGVSKQSSLPAQEAATRNAGGGRHAGPAFDNGPVLVGRWRGHLEGISAIQVIDDPDLTSEPRFFSASRDKRIRMWSLKGEYIGVFGQDYAWHLDDPESWEVS